MFGQMGKFLSAPKITSLGYLICPEANLCIVLVCFQVRGGEGVGTLGHSVFDVLRLISIKSRPIDNFLSLYFVPVTVCYK